MLIEQFDYVGGINISDIDRLSTTTSTTIQNYIYDNSNGETRVVFSANNQTINDISSGTSGKPSFIHGFLAALSLVFLSEFGDRTFFIAAILAINHSRLIVFVATLLALVVNSLLACVFGALASKIPIVYIHYTSIALFILFGLKTLYDAYYMSPKNEHYYTAQSSLNPSTAQNPNPLSNGEANREDNNLQQQQQQTDDSQNLITEDPGKIFFKKFKSFWSKRFSSVFFSTFLVILVAELGDRSQLSVLVLAAKENMWAVALGTLLGQFLSTLIAVLAGHLVGEKISIRIVTFIAGILFLVFALVSLISGVPKDTNATKEHS